MVPWTSELVRFDQLSRFCRVTVVTNRQEHRHRNITYHFTVTLTYFLATTHRLVLFVDLRSL